MSKRQDTSRPVSQSSADGLNDRLPTDSFRGQGGQHAGLDHGDEVSRERNLQQPNHQPAAQPPAQHYTPMTPGNSRTSAGSSRGVGVHTMLNPTESGTNSGYSTLGSNAQNALSDRSLPQQTTGADTPTLSSRSNHSSHSPGLFPTNSGFVGGSRRLAPNVHRSVSLGNTAMGTQSPFGQPPPEREIGWPHVVVPGSGASSEIPPLPAIPAHIRSPINLPPPVTGPLLNRRASVAVMGGPTARLPNSQSASPNSPLSYSNHPSPAPMTQMSQPPTGQAYLAGSTLMGPFPEGASPQGGQQEQGPYMGNISDRIPPQGSSSGGHDPQYLFLATERGEIMVPVDVEVGSIEAGNKRKRNADASRRFRNRRKDQQEKEDKQISDLEEKVQEKDRLAEFYKERSDFFQGETERLWHMLHDNPATRSQALQAPPRNPPQFRYGLPSGPSLQSPGGEMGQSERPPRRRRLDNEGEVQEVSNQPRLEEGQYIQHPPPTTPYAPAPSRLGGQHPQNLPPHTRSISGPGLGSNWPSNAALQPPRSIFHPQSSSGRPWLSRQPQQPPQAQQHPQHQSQYQAQNQAQNQAQYQAQNQVQQQSQQPMPPAGDTSGQRQ